MPLRRWLAGESAAPAAPAPAAPPAAAVPAPAGAGPNGSAPAAAGGLDLDALGLRLLDAVPVNVLVADRDLVLRYMNEASRRTLRTIEHELPIPVDEMLGSSIDVYHRNPPMQHRLLANPRNLPHQARIRLGAELMDLNVQAIVDADGAYVGAMTTWELVTSRVKAEAEIARVTSMMENAPMPMLYADRDLVVRYVNPATLRLLRTLERHLPMRAEQVIGASLDSFHHDPAAVRRIAGDPRMLPHRSTIEFGGETIDLLVSAVTNADGEHVGTMSTWEVITERVLAEAERERVAVGLADVIADVNENAASLAASAEELDSVSQTLAAGAEETSAQAAAVTEAGEVVSINVTTMATSLEEMRASIREIARNASGAAQVAGQATVEAGAANDIIGRLGASSSEIGEVVELISSIAEETNLLALNATIEAARAGEAGKGFAVVANEVKELADETAKATKDIRRRIAAIQAETHSAVEAIERISLVIGQIHDTQNAIASAVEEQSAATEEVTRNVAEVATAMGEVAATIAGVGVATRATAAAANDTRQAAGELTRMAASLQGVAETGASLATRH